MFLVCPQTIWQSSQTIFGFGTLWHEVEDESDIGDVGAPGLWAADVHALGRVGAGHLISVQHPGGHSREHEQEKREELEHRGEHASGLGVADVLCRESSLDNPVNIAHNIMMALWEQMSWLKSSLWIIKVYFKTRTKLIGRVKSFVVVLLTQMIYIEIWWKFRSCDGPVAQDTRECAHDQVLLFYVFIFVL